MWMLFYLGGWFILAETEVPPIWHALTEVAAFCAIVASCSAMADFPLAISLCNVSCLLTCQFPLIIASE